MKIECLIRRKKGTLVEFKADGKAYHFTPDEEGRHVAEVDDKAHAKVLLSIEPEAYIKYGTEPKSARYQKRRKKVDVETEQVDLEDLGDTDAPEKDAETQDQEIESGDSGELDADDMKALIDDDDDDGDNESVGSLDEGDDNVVVDYEALSEEELRGEYERVFGKKPHHKMKLETILEKLNESKG